MTKQAPTTGLDGSIGQSSVKLAFEKLGWGPIPVAEHDTGTDAFVQVRDDDLFELGLLLGVQVKNEKAYFDDAARSAAMATDPAGWWYRASQQDVAYWLDHSVPHILVLYDRFEEESYWGHVTREAVEWTDKGAKIWVPADQRLDASSKQRLLRIAAKSRPTGSWSGSAWHDLERVPPGQRLRFALLAPRIAAPHLNRSVEHVGPEQAIANLVLGRIDELAHLEGSAIPAASDRQAGTFGWRLYDGLFNYFTSHARESLESLLEEDLLTDSERAAVVSAVVATSFELGDVDGVEAIVGEDFTQSLKDPVDRAWVTMHRARAMLEVGQASEAKDLALQVAAVGLLHADDPTALSLRAAAMNLVFTISPWEAEHLKEMIIANDSPPTWWADQQRSWALSHFLEERFESWVGKPSREHPGRRSWLTMRGLVLQAGLVGDQQVWRSATSQLARLELLMSEHRPPEELLTILGDVRLAGGKENLRLLLAKFRQDGPTEVVRNAAANLDLRRSTRTTSDSDIELVRRTVDMMADEDLARHADQILRYLRQAEGRVVQTRQHVFEQMVVMIRSLALMCRRLDHDTRSELRDMVLSAQPVTDQRLAHAYAALVSAIPVEDWEADEGDRVRERLQARVAEEGGESEEDDWPLREAWLWLLVELGDSALEAELLEQAREGGSAALRSLGTLSRLSQEALRDIVQNLRRDLAERRDEAAQGRASMSTNDPGELLFRINLYDPAISDWEPIEWVLAGPAMDFQLEPLLKVIAQRHADLPHDLVDMLLPLLERLSERATPKIPFFNIDVSDLARTALYALDDALDSAAAVLEKLGDGERGRIALCGAIGRRGTPEHASLLAALSTDGNSSVRSAAAGAAAEWLVREEPPTLVHEALLKLLNSDGFGPASAVLRRLSEAPELPRVEPVLRTLQAHGSASIRRHVRHLLAGITYCDC